MTDFVGDAAFLAVVGSSACLSSSDMLAGHYLRAVITLALAWLCGVVWTGFVADGEGRVR